MKKFSRANLEELLARRFFYRPSFDIYGSVAGFYDLGPPGCAIQANILNLWRQFFVLEEQMLEVDCTLMTKDEVFMCGILFLLDFLEADNRVAPLATLTASPTPWCATRRRRSGSVRIIS